MINMNKYGITTINILIVTITTVLSHAVGMIPPGSPRRMGPRRLDRAQAAALKLPPR